MAKRQGIHQVENQHGEADEQPVDQQLVQNPPAGNGIDHPPAAINPDDDKPGWIGEAFLRRNRQTVTLLSVAISLLAFWVSALKFSSDRNEAKHKEIADLAAAEQKKVDQAKIDLLNQSNHDLQISNNAIELLNIVLRFSTDLRGEDVTDSSVAGQVKTMRRINLPAYRALVSLSDLLLTSQGIGNGSAKNKPDDSQTIQKQFDSTGRHICRMLFAKVRDEDPAVSGAALCAIGHILNTDELMTAIESSADRTFTTELNEAFQGARFRDALFQDIRPNVKSFNLAHADFTGARLPKGAAFDRCNLVGATFSGAVLTDASFYGVNHRSAPLSSADKTSFDNAIIGGCSFKLCNFEHASFEGCSFGEGVTFGPGVNMDSGRLVSLKGNSRLAFENCVLTNVILSNETQRPLVIKTTRIDGSDLSGAVLSDAIFSGVQARRTTYSDSALSRSPLARLPVFSECDLRAANFMRCKTLNHEHFGANVRVDWARINVDCPLYQTISKDQSLQCDKMSRIVVVGGGEKAGVGTYEGIVSKGGDAKFIPSRDYSFGEMIKDLITYCRAMSVDETDGLNSYEVLGLKVPQEATLQSNDVLEQAVAAAVMRDWNVAPKPPK